MFPVLGYADLHCFSFVFLICIHIYRAINVELWLLLYDYMVTSIVVQTRWNKNSHLAMPGITVGLGWPRLWEQMCSFFWPFLGLPSALVSYPCWCQVAHLKKKRKKMFPVKYYLTAYYIFFMTSDITLVVSIQHSLFMLECAGEDRSGGEKD